MVAAFAGAALTLTFGLAWADGSGDPNAVRDDKGEWFDKDGNPTFHVDKGQVDYYTFVGYIRYTANCMQCHGPDGLGSTYAPALAKSLQHLNYADFIATVAQGKKAVSASQQLVMPTFGENKNVTCYLDAIYTYLRARSDDAVGRGRPQNHADRPQAFTDAENQCMG